LKGLSPAEIDDIVLDYEAHFSDAVADGRNETEVAASLGDPLRLGGELSAETKMRRWETRRGPRTFVQAGLGLVGLQAFNIFVLLPVIAALLFCAGDRGLRALHRGQHGFHLLGGLLSGNGNVAGSSAGGIGLICGVVGIGGLITLLLDGGLRLPQPLYAPQLPPAETR